MLLSLLCCPPMVISVSVHSHQLTHSVALLQARALCAAQRARDLIKPCSRARGASELSHISQSHVVAHNTRRTDFAFVARKVGWQQLGQSTPHHRSVQVQARVTTAGRTVYKDHQGLWYGMLVTRVLASEPDSGDSEGGRCGHVLPRAL